MEIWLATDKEWLARFRLDDKIREDASQALQALRKSGIETLLLSGDRSGHVQQVAHALGIDRAIGEASPEQKLEVLEQLRADGHRVMMVGDGLNDLPSMAGAGISVAMGTAADLTQLKADAVLLNGQLNSLVAAIETSKQTRKIIRQNMIWAFGYNVAPCPWPQPAWCPLACCHRHVPELTDRCAERLTTQPVQQGTPPPEATLGAPEAA